MAITTGALLGAAGIGAVGNLIGGIFGSSSQKSANKTNLQIARETNAQNKELFNQQLAWQEDMWNKTNAYNAPQNQVDMLLKAGINPAAVYGTGSTSDASMPSVPSSPQMQGATMQPIDYSWMGNIVDQGVNAYLNNSILNNKVEESAADAQIAKVKAEFDAMSVQHRLIQIINDAQSSGYEKEMAKGALDLFNMTKKDQYLQQHWNTQVARASYDEALSRIALNQIQQESVAIANKWLPVMNQHQLQVWNASIQELYASARSHDASALYSTAQAALSNLQAEGVKMDNTVKENVIDDLIDEIQYRVDQQYYDAQSKGKEFRLGKYWSDRMPDPASAVSGGSQHTDYRQRGWTKDHKNLRKDKDGRLYWYNPKTKGKMYY